MTISKELTNFHKIGSIALRFLTGECVACKQMTHITPSFFIRQGMGKQTRQLSLLCLPLSSDWVTIPNLIKLQ